MWDEIEKKAGRALIRFVWLCLYFVLLFPKDYKFQFQTALVNSIKFLTRKCRYVCWYFDLNYMWFIFFVLVTFFQFYL